MTPSRPNNLPGGKRFTLEALAREVGGRVEGKETLEISGIAGLEEAGREQISFLAGRRRPPELATTRAAALIVREDVPLPGKNLIRVKNPHLAFARILEIFHPPERPAAGRHPTAVVERGAQVDPAATVSAFCYLGPGSRVGPGTILHPHCYLGPESVLGEEDILHPHVTVRGGVQVGNRVVIHSGTVIGSDGFGYAPDGAGHRKIPQVGGVEIGDDAEIGAGVTIDRATTGTTRIGRGVKIDNLVQIAHNVEVGANSIIVAQVGISGSTRIGEGAALAGQVGVAQHLRIGDGARVGAQSGVLRDVPSGQTMSGMGPLPHQKWLRSQAIFDKLPELRKRLQLLEEQVERLEKKLRNKVSN